MPSAIVIDNSFFAALFIPDEDEAHIVALFNEIDSISQLLAPDLLINEFANMLLQCQKRARMTEAEVDEALTKLPDYAINLHRNSQAQLQRQLSLARKHGLSFYDALYLDLAISVRAQLATLDSKLRTAAQAEGVTLYQPAPAAE